MTEKAKQLGNEMVNHYITTGLPDSKGIVEVKIHDGLTKREYFTGLAMIGLLSATTYSTPGTMICAEKSVKYSDALLEELSKTK